MVGDRNDKWNRNTDAGKAEGKHKAQKEGTRSITEYNGVQMSTKEEKTVTVLLDLTRLFVWLHSSTIVTT